MSRPSSLLSLSALGALLATVAPAEGAKHRHDDLLQPATYVGVNRRSAASFLQQREEADTLPSLEAAAGKSGRLKSAFPWYHTSEEIHSEAKRLVGKCGGKASLKTIAKRGVSIDVITVKKQDAKPTNKVFILFGEHSRELISPESGVHLLKVLCGEASSGKDSITGAAALEDSEFQLVLNGNPRSRTKVESGHYCVRENPDGVDLNRNWDEMWKASRDEFSEQNPGPRPFSEPETQIFKDLVMEYKPTTFLTVHSGTRGMYMPWAYDTEHLASRNQPSMMRILKQLDSKHCQCPFGAAGKEVGYACPGTCLDWVYDQLKAPYSFAFEIYTSPDSDGELKSRWEEKVHSGGSALLEAGSHLGHPHFLDLFQDHASDFVQVSEAQQVDETRSEEMTEFDCFTMFNPDTKERYDATVQNWAAAYLEMSRLVSQELRSNSTMMA